MSIDIAAIWWLFPFLVWAICVVAQAIAPVYVAVPEWTPCRRSPQKRRSGRRRFVYQTRIGMDLSQWERLVSGTITYLADFDRKVVVGHNLDSTLWPGWQVLSCRSGRPVWAWRDGKKSYLSFTYNQRFAPEKGVELMYKPPADFTVKTPQGRLTEALTKSCRSKRQCLKFEADWSVLDGFSDLCGFAQGRKSPVIPRLTVDKEWDGTFPVLNMEKRETVAELSGKAIHTLGGFPMTAMLANDGDLTPSLAPIASCSSKEASYSLARSGHVLYHSSGMLWEPAMLGMSWHLFGAFDCTRAEKSFASTIVKWADKASNRNVRVIVADMSADESFAALKKEGFFRNSVLAYMHWGRNYDSSRIEQEVDGMGLFGRDVLPRFGKKQHPAQVRVTDVIPRDNMDFFEHWGRELEARICALGDATDSTIDGVYLSVVNAMEADFQDRLERHEVAEGILDYCKGLFVPSCGLQNDVAILDLNMLKGKNKGKLKKLVAERGFVLVGDAMLGIVKSDPLGGSNPGSQEHQFIMDCLPVEFPVPEAGGSHPLHYAQQRYWQRWKDALDAYNTGDVVPLFRMINSGKHPTETERKVEEMMFADKRQRKLIQMDIAQAVLKGKYAYITKGMEVCGDIKMRTSYAWDWNGICDSRPDSERPERSLIPWLEADAYGNAVIRLHDGIIQKLPVVLMNDKGFWKGMEDAEYAVGIMKRNPVANWNVHGPALCINPWMVEVPSEYAQEKGRSLAHYIPTGVGISTAAMKWTFTGDTDGDVLAYSRLQLKVQLNELNGCFYIADFREEDYAPLYGICSAAVEVVDYNGSIPPTRNVEEWMQNATAAVRGLGLRPIILPGQEGMDADSEALVGKNCQVGSTSLLMVTVNRCFKALARTDSRLKRESAMWSSFFKGIIIAPLYACIGALTEMWISLEKKYTLPFIKELLDSQLVGPLSHYIDEQLERPEEAPKDDQGNPQHYLTRKAGKLYHLGKWFEEYCVRGVDRWSIQRFDGEVMGSLATAINKTMLKLEIAVDHQSIELNEDGTRFIDAQKTKKLEGFSLHYDEAWGIWDENGFGDSFHWMNVNSNEHIETIKKECLRWTQFEDGEQEDFDHTLNHNRAHVSKWVGRLFSRSGSGKPDPAVCRSIEEILRHEAMAKTARLNAVGDLLGNHPRDEEQLREVTGDMWSIHRVYKAYDGSLFLDWLLHCAAYRMAGSRQLSEDLAKHVAYLFSWTPKDDDYNHRFINKWVDKLHVLAESSKLAWVLLESVAERADLYDGAMAIFQATAGAVVVEPDVIVVRAALEKAWSLECGQLTRDSGRHLVKAIGRDCKWMAAIVRENKDAVKYHIEQIGYGPVIEHWDAYSLDENLDQLCENAGIPGGAVGNMKLFALALEGLRELGCWPDSIPMGHNSIDRSYSDYIFALVRKDLVEDVRHSQKRPAGVPHGFYVNADDPNWDAVSLKGKERTVTLEQVYGTCLVDDAGPCAVFPVNPMESSWMKGYDRVELVHGLNADNWKSRKHWRSRFEDMVLDQMQERLDGEWVRMIVVVRMAQDNDDWMTRDTEAPREVQNSVQEAQRLINQILTNLKGVENR